MRMRETSTAVVIVAAAVLALAGAGPAARADRPMPFAAVGAPVIGALQFEAPVAAEPLAAGAMRPAGRLQGGAVPVASEDFEGDFPPPGWTTFDLRARGGGTENYTWGNQELIVALPANGRPGGDLRAPWAMGGGRLGAAVAPGSNYTQPLASALVYGPFDASDFDGGVQVDFLSYLDGPVDAVDGSLTSFGVCVTTPDPNNTPCRGLIVRAPDGSDLRKRWLSLREPMKFPLAAGLSAVSVYFLARDDNPTGAHTASLIDNVTIEGLSSSVPTATLEPGETPPATAVPNTPAPEVTVPAATPDSRVAYLPLSVHGVDKDVMAPVQPTGLPGTVDVAFGTSVAANGTLVGRATRFGRIARLCSVQRWTGVPVGTQLAVQWYEANGRRWNAIVLSEGNEDLNPVVQVASESGGLQQCIFYDDGTPIAAGRFRVAVYLRGETVAWGDEVAEVTGEGGEPTPGGPTPVPSATPKLPDNCQNPVVNGDFEQGGEGWQGAARNGHELLRSPGFASLIAAQLGGYDDAEDILLSTGRIDTLPIADIESVTVRWAIGLDGTETRGNGDDADRFLIGVEGDDADHRTALFLSEDTAVDGALIPLQRWFQLQATVSEMWAKSDGYATARILFAARTNASNPMYFGLDNVVVEYCRKAGGAPLRAPVRWTHETLTDAELDDLWRSARPFGATELRPIAGAATRPFAADPGR